MKAIVALMEDESGEAIVLQLYQQEDGETRKAIDIVNVDTILLVKKPNFKIMGDGDASLNTKLSFLDGSRAWALAAPSQQNPAQSPRA